MPESGKHLHQTVLTTTVSTPYIRKKKYVLSFQLKTFISQRYTPKKVKLFL